ncbi:uncharacterized protein LOC135221408 [Macrobrachium nipponense]|uniref:uncharacterized protein LOC135221408 n=1 Tax=Macrobrachium nipponense TaxID=159736 RepID=UPI0030C84CB4
MAALAAAASLATVVIGGAVGIGLASIAAHFTRRSGYGRHHYRYGRSAQDDSSALERTMNLIRQQDFSGCGLKLVCDLASMTDDQLASEEMSILSLVGTSIKPGEGLLPTSALQEYQAARGLGEYGYDCALAFPSCPLNSTQLIETVMSYLP